MTNTLEGGRQDVRWDSRQGCGPTVTQPVSGRLAVERREADRRRGDGDPFRDDRVISPMAVAAAGLTFFFNVRNFAAGGHLAIAADNAPAGESREAEKPNETVHADLRCNRSAICMPLKFSPVR